jgi:hypothetical protein
LLLALATRGLPPGRQDWGRAMRAELDGVHGGRARWGFSLGCARASGLVRARVTLTSRERGGASLRAVVFASVVAAVALAAYGVVRYPGLPFGHDTWAYVSVFAILLVFYAGITLTLSGGATLLVAAARHYGLAGGLAIGSAWFLVLSPPDDLKNWVLAPLAVTLLGPACIAALAARSARDVTAGTRAALWSGIVGGLVSFIVWMTATYVRDGRPYDAGLLRDFHHSGSPDLATYAVRNDFGSGLTLLVLVPVVALAFGSLGARLPRAIRAPHPGN